MFMTLKNQKGKKIKGKKERASCYATVQPPEKKRQGSSRRCAGKGGSSRREKGKKPRKRLLHISDLSEKKKKRSLRCGGAAGSWDLESHCRAAKVAKKGKAETLLLLRREKKRVEKE